MPDVLQAANRLDKARYDQVIWSRVCPNCGNHTVIDIVRMSKKDVLSRDSKYLGTYHSCGGPRGYRCWHMTKFEPAKPEKALYETFGSKSKIRECIYHSEPGRIDPSWQARFASTR